MAVLTTLVGFWAGRTDVSSAAVSTLALDPQKNYSLRHTGKDSSGAAATGLIRVALPLKTTGVPADPTADSATGTNELVMESGDVVNLPVGCNSIKHRAASGTPVLQVLENNYVVGAV